MVYGELAKMCFIADPMKRSTFSDIVQQLEKWLNDEEKQEYHRQSEQYASMRSVISNSDTQPKKSATINSKLLNVGNNGNRATKEEDDTSYLDMTQNASPKYSQIKSQTSPVQIEKNHVLTNDNNDDHAHPMNYVMLSYNKVNCDSDTKEEICDIVGNGIEGCDDSNGINVTVTQSKLELLPNSNNGYITIDAANNS
jgi:hypothetical protein